LKTSLIKTKGLLVLALLCAVTGAVSAAGDAESEAAKAEMRKTIRGCAQGLERLLPGDYYFCAAARDMSRGHNGLSRERLRDAAHWASKPAQYVLGLIYYNGDEGPANRPLGIAWLALAAERHDPRFEPAFANAYAHASPQERGQANAYWLKLREDYADAVAGRRAHRRFLAEMRNITAISVFGGWMHINGLAPMDQFAFMRAMNAAGDTFFRGMGGTVTVGEGETSLVPIGKAVGYEDVKAN
jgi:hypothetical protein